MTREQRRERNDVIRQANKAKAAANRDVVRPLMVTQVMSPNGPAPTPTTGASSISPKVWECDQCGAEGTEEGLLLSHTCVSATPTASIGRWTCPICDMLCLYQTPMTEAERIGHHNRVVHATPTTAPVGGGRKDELPLCVHVDEREPLPTQMIITGNAAQGYSGGTKFVRNDVHATTLARVLELEGVLADCVRSLERLPDVDGAYRVTCISQARAALNKDGEK